ncbi:MAG: SIS domain-containing protein [Candidatus Brocadiia bacterium]
MSERETEYAARAAEVLRREARAVDELAERIDESIVEVAQALLDCRGHILVTGAGTSHAVAARLAHLLACVGRPALCINAADSLHGGAGAVTERDIVYAISKGGRSTEINEFVRIVKERGATIVAQTESANSPLGRMSDVVFRVSAPEDVDPYGMIATGSSLVNAAAGDALCVLLLEMSGYSKEEFGATHPGGAVGERLQQEERP